MRERRHDVARAADLEFGLQLREHLDRAIQLGRRLVAASKRVERARELGAGATGFERRARLQVAIDGVFEMLARFVGVSTRERHVARRELTAAFSGTVFTM